MSARSYQNIASMPGWNDCPAVIPNKSLKKKARPFSSRNSSQTSLYMTPPRSSSQLSLPLPSASVSADQEQPKEPGVSTEDLQTEWERVTQLENGLSEKEFKYHNDKIRSVIPQLTKQHACFLYELLKSSECGEKPKEELKEECVTFMMQNDGVTWCLSARKILENVKI